jgi:hypothetical protein
MKPLTQVKEIKGLRGGALIYAVQGNLKIDTVIGKKRHFRVETV